MQEKSNLHDTLEEQALVCRRNKSAINMYIPIKTHSDDVLENHVFFLY